jgi:hypothetical protein
MSAELPTRFADVAQPESMATQRSPFNSGTILFIVLSSMIEHSISRHAYQSPLPLVPRKPSKPTLSPNDLWLPIDAYQNAMEPAYAAT